MFRVELKRKTSWRRSVPSPLFVPEHGIFQGPSRSPTLKKVPKGTGMGGWGGRV